MAIMVAGGLTFAIPGMEPAYAAQISSNPNLKVSAEGQNADNEIASTNIVQVVVIDDLTDNTDNSPIVTVNGADFTPSMYFYSGAWYGYFADTDITDTGLATDQLTVNALVTGNPGRTSATDGALGTGDIPGVLLVDLDGDFDVVYERPGADQTVSMELDDPDTSISLDRSNYPQNTDVVATLDDQALNVDPTGEDTWYFTTGGDPVYGTAVGVDDIGRQATAQTTRDNTIAAANAAHEDETRNAAAIRDKAIADALDDLNAVKAALADLPSLLTYSASDRTTEENRRATVLSEAQDAHDAIAGKGTRTSDSDADENYKGSALVAYELANAATGTANAPATVRDDAITEANRIYNDATFNVPTTGISGFEAFGVLANGLLECATNDCAVIDGNMWVKFTEGDSNESTFTNSPDDASSLKTTADASRGLSFSVTYDNTATSGIGYSTTDIVIDAGDEWNSGQEIGITLTDSDANTNSLSEETLEVSDPNRMVPTITIGDPHTLTNGIDATLSGDVASVGMKNIDDDGVSQRMVITTGGEVTGEQTIVIAISHDAEAADGVYQVVNYDLSAFGDADLTIGTNTAALSGTFVVDDANPIPETFTLTFSDNDAEPDDNIPTEAAIAIDIFTFGYADGENVNNAIYRLELEEDDSNSSDFIGTLEYVGLNQININEQSTYEGIDASGDSIILISDDDSISVEYRDLDSTGGYSTFTAGADTPTHSGSVSLDSDGYKVADTVLVTVEDADLNVDSGKADVYTAYEDKIDSANSVMELFSVSIDSNDWDDRCGEKYGLEETKFTLRETGNDSGVFTGTFSIPAEYCADSNSEATTVTGADISVEYVDFRDDSGSTITVSASAGIRSSTGSVSLDRTVYPVPFGEDDPTDANDDTFFATSNDDNPLAQGDLTVYVSVADSDADTSANGIDTIDASTVSIEIIRGSAEELVTITDSEISETASDSGVFELEMSIAYNSGPGEGCPTGLANCILQGDILHVVYEDQSDASGSLNTVTDSATFDLRNGVLQSDQTAYIIGSDAIITLIEPDLNLDSGSTETYTLDLIEWDSDAGTASLDDGVFAATPSNLLETGDDTGIFQVVVGVPQDIDGDRLERGEEITLTYVDWGPSGADYVGDKDEEITTTIYTSNFGATIELDQRVYTWTDKVYVTVVAPDHNVDVDQVDEIGNNDDYPIRVSTRGNDIDEYKLVETGADTGIFSGEITLIGFEHDADGDGNDDAGGQTSPDRSGPTDGQIGTESESGISVSFKYSDGETVSSSALIRWNVGEVQWLEASYPASGSGIVRVIDPDMNLNPEAVDNFDITVWSDSDGGGIDLTVTETNAATGIFEGTTFFGVGVDTSGHRLRVVEGDTVTAQYYDNTLPAPFKETERVRVGATTLIGTVVPPLERAPISDLRAVDSFGSTLDVISVDSQIQLAADLTNNQDKSQEFAYLIQIQNESGVTVSLNWITGSLSAGQSLSPASSWTPDEAGTYEVTAFVWESIENPTALSPTATIAITVN